MISRPNRKQILLVGLLAGAVVVLAVLIAGRLQLVNNSVAHISEPGDLAITRGGGNSACGSRTNTLVIHVDGSGYTKTSGNVSTYCPTVPESTFPKGTFDRASLDKALSKLGGVDKIPALQSLKFNPAASGGVIEGGCAPAGDVGYVTVSYNGQTSPDIGCYQGDDGATNVDPNADAFVQLVLKADKR